jgi:hypothetical protein
MATSDLSHLQAVHALAADGRALHRVLKQAGLTKDSVVRVTGPAGPTAALWLYRHGYEYAAYVHPNWVAAKTSADALLIPHACGAEELSGLLQDGDCVREGGVLIVQASSDRFARSFDSLRAMLRPRGYQVEKHISDRGLDICIARRLGSGGVEQAA